LIIDKKCKSPFYLYMIIETDSREVVLEYLLINSLLEESVIDYLLGVKKLNFVNEMGTIDLFDESVPIQIIDKVDSTMNDGIYWILKLSAEDKKIIKKENLPSVTIKKITKSLLPRLLQELNFKSRLTEFTSYYEIIEEEYITSLGGKVKTKIQEPLLFMFGLNSLDKFYNKAIDDEFQLILSLIFSKALIIEKLPRK
jgi:hypothetical protein